MEINILKLKHFWDPQTGRSFSSLFFTFPSVIHVLCLLHEQFATWSSTHKDKENCLKAFYGRTTQLILLLSQVSQFIRYLAFPFCPPISFLRCNLGCSTIKLCSVKKINHVIKSLKNLSFGSVVLVFQYSHIHFSSQN